MARIELVTHIAAPRERCFDLARSVEVHTRSTSATGERAIAGKMAGLLALGDQVTWRARHLGVWQTLTSRITAFDRPAHFRDSMVRGAFARLDHDHFFAGLDGGTVMRDVFDYRAPLGPLGWLAERLFLTRYLRTFLEARNRDIKLVAESSAWKEFVGADDPPPHVPA
jgi:ligand-binding SRPBCC domain-containing protein